MLKLRTQDFSFLEKRTHPLPIKYQGLIGEIGAYLPTFQGLPREIAFPIDRAMKRVFEVAGPSPRVKQNH